MILVLSIIEYKGQIWCGPLPLCSSAVVLHECADIHQEQCTKFTRIEEHHGQQNKGWSCKYCHPHTVKKLLNGDIVTSLLPLQVLKSTSRSWADFRMTGSRCTMSMYRRNTSNSPHPVQATTPTIQFVHLPMTEFQYATTLCCRNHGSRPPAVVNANCCQSSFHAHGTA